MTADAIIAVAGVLQPEIVVVGATFGNHPLFQNQEFFIMLDQCKLPSVIAKDFALLGVVRANSDIARVLRQL